MKLLNTDLVINDFVHNDLKCYVKSGYGGKNIKVWPFYKFIKMWVNGNRDQARILWINWLIKEFLRYRLDEKSIGGMFQGSVHRYAVDHININKKKCWLYPSLLSKTQVKQGAAALVDRRIKMISSIINKGYRINLKDPILVVKVNNYYVLKGGHHRATVMYVLGYKKLPGIRVYSKYLWECRKWLVKIKNFLR